jgi:hypothetical protein
MTPAEAGFKEIDAAPLNWLSLHFLQTAGIGMILQPIIRW